MINVKELTDSTALIGNPEALRQRYDEDGVLFLRGVIDPELMAWAIIAVEAWLRIWALAIAVVSSE